MNLIIDYDQNPSSLPSGFVNGINSVVNYYDTVFTANVTVTIDVGFGEIDGQRLESGALGESEQLTVSPVSYSSVRNALVAEAAPGSSTLPTLAPLGSPGVLYMPSAQEKALGLISNNTSVDGYIGFDSSSGTFGYGIGSAPPSSEYYFLGVAEHEISEIMGRTSYLGYTGAYSSMDLYRYSAPGARQFTTGAPSYFSINSGTTNLDNWNNFQTGNDGDLGDWAPSAGNDAYDDNSYPGVVNSVSQADLTLMAALGWSPTSSASPAPTPAPPTTGLQFVGVGEFGAGGTAALAWQTGGQIEIWSNNGGGIAASLVANASMGAAWRAAGVVDFHNGTDAIVWNNGTGGQIAIWQLNGSTLTGFGTPNGAMGTEWSVVSTGDFDGNGSADVLWHDQNTNQVSVWYLNGTGLSSFGTVNDTITGAYHVAATGDFFQAGRDGVLWESTSGQLQDWLLNGLNVQSMQNVGQMGAAWQVAGVGEFNGIANNDPTSDIVWVDSSNDVQIWQMTGGQITQFVNPSGHDGTEWQLRGVGDFTNSGSSELLWLDGKGDAQIWQLNGAQVSVISTTAPAGTTSLPADTTTPPESSLYTGSAASSSLSFGDIGDLQYVSAGQTVTNPVIDAGMLQLTSGAIVDGTITFGTGGTGTLLDADQAALPDTVVGFNEGGSYLSFAGETAATEAQVIASAQIVGGNTVLIFPDHTSIVLAGITHVDTGVFA